MTSMASDLGMSGLRERREDHRACCTAGSAREPKSDGVLARELDRTFGFHNTGYSFSRNVRLKTDYELTDRLTDRTTD
eukprot:SAG11_NODE_15217_length_585_cov_0.705761_1_plen_78_part_00